MVDPLGPLLADGVIEAVISRLKSGKEADIYLVEHGGEVVAAKVYKEREARNFKNNATYKEGRQVRNSRTQRAMNKGSKFGMAASEEAWKATETDALHKLHAAGCRVPQPVMFYEGVLLMELVIDPDGHPAPRLIDAHVPFELARPYYEDLRAQVVKMLACDMIHGDLSPYNVMVAWNGPTIIDFPQVVGASHNSQASFFFERDLKTIHRYFAAIDPSLAAQAGDVREIWRAYERGELTGDFVPTGRHQDALLPHERTRGGGGGGQRREGGGGDGGPRGDRGPKVERKEPRGARGGGPQNGQHGGREKQPNAPQQPHGRGEQQPGGRGDRQNPQPQGRGEHQLSGRGDRQNPQPGGRGDQQRGGRGDHPNRQQGERGDRQNLQQGGRGDQQNAQQQGRRGDQQNAQQQGRRGDQQNAQQRQGPQQQGRGDRQPNAQQGNRGERQNPPAGQPGGQQARGGGRPQGQGRNEGLPRGTRDRQESRGGQGQQNSARQDARGAGNDGRNRDRQQRGAPRQDRPRGPQVSFTPRTPEVSYASRPAEPRRDAAPAEHPPRTGHHHK